jgi:hypothetical protein
MIMNTPKVRFWAGSPMLSSESIPLGVLAIWGRQPQEEFSATQRRELAAFSAMVMTELLSQSKNFLNSSSIPTSNVPTGGSPERPRSVESAVLGHGCDTQQYLPGEIWLNKEKSFFTTSKCIANHSPYEFFGHHGVDTPPSSAECDKIPQFDNFESFGNSRAEHLETTKSFQDSCNEDVLDHDLFTQGSASSYPSSREPILPDGGFDGRNTVENGLHSLSPRPFSGSDITSLYMQPPNSPIHLLNDEELSREPDLDIDPADFITSHQELSQTLKEISEGETCPFQYQPSEPDRYSIITTSQLSDLREEDFAHSSISPPGCSGEWPEDIHQSLFERFRAVDYESIVPTAHPSTDCSPAQSSTNIDISHRLRIPRITISKTRETAELPEIPGNYWRPIPDYQAQLAMLLHHFAQGDHYDIMYVVNIRPTVRLSSDKVLFAPGGLYSQIITGYGLKDKLSVNAELHIATLRTRGFKSYWAENGCPDTGAMISIVAEGGPRQKRCSGVILGAFRMQGKGIISKYESARLENLARDIKSILLRERERRVPRSQTGSKIEEHLAKGLSELRDRRQSQLGTARSLR